MARLFALAVAVFIASAVANTVLFNDFKSTYNRKYDTPAQEQHARDCFASNLVKIDKLNAVKGNTALHGINVFTDLCEQDFKAYHSLKFAPKATYNYIPLYPEHVVRAVVNDSIDWRAKGAVTRVKDQGQCGSCWAFSAIGNMEGQNQIAHGQLLAFSEQEIVSCATNGNFGCNGGWMDNAFDWATSNGGIDSEEDYPYKSGTGQTGVCDNTKKDKKVAHFNGHVDMPKDEAQMAVWVGQNGPLSIAVDAMQGWQTYRGGVLNTCTGRQLDHGVLAVGFTADYWIVKNSWGTGWGEQGYIRLARGSNQCGLNMAASSSKAGPALA